MPFSIKRKGEDERINEEYEAEKNAEFALLRDNESLDETEVTEFQAENEIKVDAKPSGEKLPAGCKETFFDGLFFKNPSLVDFVGLTPIIMGGTSVKNGIVLSTATVTVLFAVCIFASLTKKIIPKKIAPAAYTVMAALLLIVLTWIGYTLCQEVMFSLGIVFPLIAVNGINLYRARDFASENNVKLAVSDALGKGLGFSAVLIITSAIREVLGYGTFFDITLPIFSEFHSSVISGVPGGFAVIAIFAATVQFVVQKRNAKSKNNGGGI